MTDGMTLMLLDMPDTTAPSTRFDGVASTGPSMVMGAAPHRSAVRNGCHSAASTLVNSGLEDEMFVAPATWATDGPVSLPRAAPPLEFRAQSVASLPVYEHAPCAQRALPIR